MAMTTGAKITVPVIVFLVLVVWWASLPTPPTKPSSPSSTARPVYYGPDGKEVAAPAAAGKSAQPQRWPSKPSSSSRWFEGGTLHDKTVRAWRKASHRDRLATSADFLSMLIKKGEYRSLSMPELKEAATALETCISIGTKPQTPKIPEHRNMKVAALAAACILLATTT